MHRTVARMGVIAATTTIGGLTAPAVVWGASPIAGHACSGADGKVSGRGSMVQTWLQYDLVGAYASDVCGAVAAAAGTQAVPGASYTGTADGGTVSFTVSSDGTEISSYRVAGVHGQQQDGSGCTYLGGGDAGVWPGAAISDDFFSYSVGTGILFEGSFTGAQTATGSFRFDALPGSGSSGCDTGTVAWTAATQSPPITGVGDVTHPANPLASQPTGTTFGKDWMVAYNFPSAQALGASGADAALGSGAGETAIGCRAVAFAGSDIPVTAPQLQTIDGSIPNEGGQVLGDDCDPASGQAHLVSPFPPEAPYPNPGDQGAARVMVIPVGISAVSIFANLPTGCASGSSVNLTTAEMANLWGGTYTNWDQVSSLASCDVAITRVVRSDNSGTTQGFDNYLADANGYAASDTTCQPSSATAGTYKELQNNQATNGTNLNWPGGVPATAGGTSSVSGCSPVTDNATAGGAALIQTVEGANGSAGYADYSDMIHDTNNLVSQVPGDKIVQFNLEASDGTTAVPASTATGGSDCSPTRVSLPTGGIPGAVGLNGGTTAGSGGGWNLTAQNSANATPDDIAYAREGSTYPICALTWDFVWAGEDGNSGSGPESELTSDQRRTLYSYFTYLTTPSAQTSATTAGYQSLPASWLTTIRAGFQNNF